MRDMAIVERINRAEVWQQKELAEIKSYLRRIEDKLDRKADKP